MMKTALFLFFFIISYNFSYSQDSFGLVSIPANATLGSLGGYNVSLPSEDINLSLSNPSLSSDTLSGKMSFSYTNYFADANLFSAIYQHDFASIGSLFFGFLHLDYGLINSYDETGTYLNDYPAGELLISIGKSHKVSSFRLGTNLKFVSSNVVGYQSNAILLDLGGVFIHSKKQLNIGMVIKNIGIVFQDDDFSKSVIFPTIDFEVGMTLKPKYMPVRFSITGYNFNNVYQNNNVNLEFSEVDKVLKHINMGAEFLLSNNINFRVGYNYKIRKELGLEGVNAMTGFSFGMMFQIKRFQFVYGLGRYHRASNTHNYTITIDTNKLFIKK